MMNSRENQLKVVGLGALVASCAVFLAGAGTGCKETVPLVEKGGDGHERPSLEGPPGAGGRAGEGRGSGALEQLVAEELRVDPDHRKTLEEERAVLADLYLTFTLEPGLFVEKVEQLEEKRRRQISGYLLCAAPKLASTSRGDLSGGVPLKIELPEAARDLVDYSGSKERGRTQFYRQLSGEFLVIGRLIRSIDAGDRELAGHVVARQQASLRMLELTQPPEKRLVWRQKVTKAFPPLFAGLLPGC